MKGKTVDESKIDGHTHRIFANDLNSNDTVFGGMVMAILDRLALVVAERHSGCTCVTASVDALHFLAPAVKGDNLLIYASMNRAWTSSMEIGLRVEAENSKTQQTKHIVSAYFTFVAVDEHNKPTIIPKLIPQNEVEHKRYDAAQTRRESRHSKKRK